MSSYIDLHNHILPGIDDGPRTMNEAVMLARTLVTVGYGTVVATPHAFEGKPTPAAIKTRLEELQIELNRQNIPLKLLPGAEQHIDPAVLSRLLSGEILTLNHTRYLLLELPMLQPLPPYTEQLLFDLKVHGYQPVIPHPERTVVLQKDEKLIHRLFAAGAIFQVTWGALDGWLGLKTQQTARRMLAENLAHLFATDSHNATSRLLSVSKTATYLEQQQGPGSAALVLTTRPQQLLLNQPLDIPDPDPVPVCSKKKFRFFSG